MNPIIAKFEARAQAINSLLCVGLDSAITRLPPLFLHDPHPQFAFNRWIIEQTHPFAAAYKPNMAFYEARGADGWRDLALTMDYLQANHPEIVTICDGKRADIDSTNVGYTTALYDQLGFDALTLHPYLGAAALTPFLERRDKAAIILCRTSNPGAEEMQTLDIDGVPLWEWLAVRVRDHWNTRGNCLLVIGGTTPGDLARARALCPAMTFLVPGVGAQGGDAGAVVRAGADSRKLGVIVNAGRSILFASSPQAEAQRLRDAMRAALQ